MYIRRSPLYRYICYSSVTGQAVWLYQGQSREGMKKKYYRTVDSERNRRRQCPILQQARQTNIRRLFSECMASLPILSTLTKVQRESIKALQQMADCPLPFNSPFLEHEKERRHQKYLAKRRNRYWKDVSFRQHEKERRRKKVQAKNNYNRDYDK